LQILQSTLIFVKKHSCSLKIGGTGVLILECRGDWDRPFFIPIGGRPMTASRRWTRNLPLRRFSAEAAIYPQ
jgi:hypothetical protein